MTDNAPENRSDIPNAIIPGHLSFRHSGKRPTFYTSSSRTIRFPMVTNVLPLFLLSGFWKRRHPLSSGWVSQIGRQRACCIDWKIASSG